MKYFFGSAWIFSTIFLLGYLSSLSVVYGYGRYLPGAELSGFEAVEHVFGSVVILSVLWTLVLLCMIGAALTFSRKLWYLFYSLTALSVFVIAASMTTLIVLGVFASVYELVVKIGWLKNKERYIAGVYCLGVSLLIISSFYFTYNPVRIDGDLKVPTLPSRIIQ